MAKIYIARKEISPVETPGEHSYWVYDPDENPYSGDERIIRGGPSDAEGDSGYIIEVDRPIAQSRDNLGSDDPYADRYYTTVFVGDEEDIENIWETMSNRARSLGTEEDDPWDGASGAQGVRASDDNYGLLDTNCNVLSNTVGESVNKPLYDNLPKVGGDPGTQPMGKWEFLGGAAKFQSSENETVNVTPTNRPGYDQGGEDNYVIDASQPVPPYPYVIHEDSDAATADRVTLENVDPDDLRFKRDPISGDLEIYREGEETPFVVIKGQFEGPVPKVNTLWVPDAVGGPQVLPLNNPEGFPWRVPSTVPGWVDDGLAPWVQAPHTASPLVIDLDSDGVELTTFNASTTETFFDVDGDGFAEQTAWVGADDGLLARDLDASGTIDSVAELFGSPSVDGFALLAEFDDNGDHVINQYDDVWSDLVVWKDTDGDAVTDSGELHTLASLNIVSFDLAGVTASTSTISGNPISHTSTYTLSSGATRAVADAWFVHDNVNSFYVEDYTVDIRTHFLPTLRGFGELADLHIAMSQNEDLLELVQEFVVNWDISRFEDGASLDADVQEILWTWAGVEDVASNSRGGYIDAQKLEFMEEFFGNDFLQNGSSSNPYANAADRLNLAWETLFSSLKAHLMAQVGASEIFGDTIAYDVFAGGVTGDMELSQDAIDAIESGAPAPGTALVEYWREVGLFIALTKGFGGLTTAEEEMLDDAVTATDPTTSWEEVAVAVEARLEFGSDVSDDDVLYGTSGADTLYGYSGDDELTGYAGNDTLDGGSGSDILKGGDDNDTLVPGSGGNNVQGGNGNDAYVYGGGDDIYYDTGGTDTIILPAGIVAGDLEFFREAPDSGPYYNDITIKVGSLGYVTLDYILSYGRDVFTSRVIETFTFSDTTTLNVMGFSDLITHGTSGNDTIAGVKTAIEINDIQYGYAGDDNLEGQGGNDILDGGIGNDLLEGGSGDDIYIFSPGFDVIQENGGNDTLRLPDGYDASDVSFVRLSSKPNALIVMVDGLGQAEISAQFYGAGGGAVETIDFNGSSAISISTMSIETVGTSGNDTLSKITTGGSINDIMDGGAGNDVLNGYEGNDTYWFSSGSDVVYDSGSGVDIVRFREGVLPTDIQIYRGGTAFADLIIADAFGNSLKIANQFSSAASSIEKIIFHDSTEWVLANIEVETRGTSGNDTVYAQSYGDASTADTVYGFAGTDNLNGGYGNDVLYGGDGNDNIDGGQDNDALYGDSGNDYLNGNIGDDWLYGGAGDDDLNGGLGNDVYFWVPDEGNDSIDEENSASNNFDTLIVGGGYSINDVLVVNESSNHAKLTVSGVAGQVIIEDLRGSYVLHVEQILFSDGFFTELPTYNSWLKGTSGNDAVAGNSSANTLIGYAGNDTMTGGAGDDDMHGGAGNDTLDGDDGTDLLYGGDGDDILYGEGGLDTLHGGAGADIFTFFTASAFSNIDVIRDFSVSDDDVIDLTDILDTAYDPLTDDIADFISFSESSGSTFVSVDRDGTGGTYSMAQIIKLENVTGLSSVATLETNGNLVAA